MSATTLPPAPYVDTPLAPGFHVWPQTLAAAQKMLAREFAIEHVTLQPDWPRAPTGRKVIPVAALEADGDAQPRAAIQTTRDGPA